MPLQSNVLVSAYALGLDGSEREPESGVMPTPPEDATPARDDLVSGVVAVPPPAHAEGAPPEDDEERPSRPIARIAITRVAAMATPATAELRGVELALSGAPQAHVTIALANGMVLHEGATGDDGRMTVRLDVPRNEVEVRAMIELGSKHRTALVRIADEGPTQFTFR